MATAADVLIETIADWGVEVVFGLPGDGINGIMEALRTRKDRIRFVQVRHEEAAAFMACGYAKWTGRLGVCLATSGPGGIHLLNGLYDAKLDQAPVLAITGMAYHDLIGTHTQQDVFTVAPAGGAPSPFLEFFHEFEAQKAQSASAPLVQRMPVNPELLARQMGKKARTG